MATQLFVNLPVKNPSHPRTVDTMQRMFSHLGQLIMVAAMLAALSSCSYPPWYTVIIPNKQTPSSVTVTGPHLVSPGTYTYTVQVIYDNPISTQGAFIVRADIYEDDIGDVLLDRNVVISLPANATSGSATFQLSCVDDGAGNLTIVGQDGTNTYDDQWEVFAYVREQVTSESKEGDNHIIRCEIP